MSQKFHAVKAEITREEGTFRKSLRKRAKVEPDMDGGYTMKEREYPAPPEYGTFKENVRSLTGIDLNAYKYQIHRRVHMLMQRWRVQSYEEYYRTIASSEEKLREFLDYLTINVSEFFRNPQRWWEIKDKIIPSLLKDRRSNSLRLWSAGSATGEEPYSLSMLALECGLSTKEKIRASDIDAGVIKKAQKGEYHKRQLVNVPEPWKKKYFRPGKEEFFEISQDVKSRVQFVRENLIEDSFQKNLDLILCRNVVIYFSPETKSKLYRKFYDSLVPGGYLMVGSTEQIFEYRKIGFVSAGPFLYQKP